ncbi:MAG: metal-dependent hydrolase [Candidatus Binatia bacterium]
MDTLTHALSGALLARATAPKSPRADQLPRRLRMLVGFLVAMIPDSDVIFSFIDPLTYLAVHRGVTHSIILLPVWAVGLAYLFSLISRRRYPWKAFVGVCMLGIAIHIVGDVITAFGTMILAPVSMWRLAIPTTFILDRYFTGIIVAGLIASAIWKNSRTPALASLAILVSYVGFQAVLLGRAVAAGHEYIAAQNLQGARAHAIPHPLSPFNWMVIVEQQKAYRLAYVNLLRNEPVPEPVNASWLQRLRASYRPVKDAEWQEVARYGTDEREEKLVRDGWKADVLARYRDFALFPALYRVDRNSRHVCVWFQDLRFRVRERAMPFRYGVCRGNTDSYWTAYRFPDVDDVAKWLERIPD